CRGTRFDDQESNQRNYPTHPKAPHSSSAPSSRGRSADKRVCDSTQPKCSERRALPVQAFACLLVATLRNAPDRNQNYDDCEWEIDEEHPSPRSMFHQPSSEYRPDGGCNRGEAGPGTDRVSARFLWIRRAND